MSVRVEHFSYMTVRTRHVPKIATRPDPITKAAEGVPLEVGTDARGKKVE